MNWQPDILNPSIRFYLALCNLLWSEDLARSVVEICVCFLDTLDALGRVGWTFAQFALVLPLDTSVHSAVAGKEEDLARWFRGFGELSSVYLLLVSIGHF